MRTKRDIQKVYHQLEKYKNEDNEYNFGFRLFEWLTNLELATDEILPELDIRKKKLMQEQYNANKSPGWIMLTPKKEWLFVEHKPIHTPKRWWTKVNLSEFKEPNITYYMDIFNLQPGNLMDYILYPFTPSWKDEYELYIKYRDYFRNVKEVNKYLIGEFGSVDESTKIIFSPEDRKNHIDSFQIHPNQLKNYYLTNMNYTFIYDYKRRNEIFWVLEKL